MTRNGFNEGLQAGRPRIGLRVALADAYAVELLATTGFDWLLLDAEQAPNDLQGIRGVGIASARASRWNQIPDCFARNDEICVLVQAETEAAMDELAAIAAVGVDGVHFGPVDLAASMRLLGRPMDPAAGGGRDA